MILIAQLLGVAIALLGLGILVKPALIKKIVDYVKIEERVYWATGLKFLIGVILLMVAPESRIVAINLVFGLLYFVGGLSGFILGMDKLKALCDWWATRPIVIVRLWAGATIIFGLLIAYAS